MTTRFKELRAVVLNFLEGYSNYNERQIAKAIEMAYQDDLIEGEEYDYLMNLLDR